MTTENDILIDMVKSRDRRIDELQEALRRIMDMAKTALAEAPTPPTQPAQDRAGKE